MQGAEACAVYVHIMMKPSHAFSLISALEDCLWNHLRSSSSNPCKSVTFAIFVFSPRASLKWSLFWQKAGKSDTDYRLLEAAAIVRYFTANICNSLKCTLYNAQRILNISHCHTAHVTIKFHINWLHNDCQTEGNHRLYTIGSGWAKLSTIFEEGKGIYWKHH